MLIAASSHDVRVAQSQWVDTAISSTVELPRVNEARHSSFRVTLYFFRGAQFFIAGSIHGAPNRTSNVL